MKNLINKFNKWFDRITGITSMKQENDKINEIIQERINSIDTFRADYRQWLNDNNISINGMNI